MISEPFNQPQYVSFQTDAKLVSKESTIRTNELNGFSVTHLSGLLIGSKGVFLKDFNEPLECELTLFDVKYSYGEWASVAKRERIAEDDYIIFSDSYGYCPVFYSLIPEKYLIISDTFHGIISALEENDITRTLDVRNYVTAISTQIAHFQNAFSHNTMSSEVKILLPGQYLHVTNQSVALMNWQDHDDQKSYELNIRNAVELASIALRALNDLPEISKRITLSGGVDSRVALALLKHAGVEKEFNIFSMDPRTWTSPGTSRVIKRDVVIANLIREKCGMSWWRPGDRSMISLDFMESLRAFQSYRSNYAFTFKPASTHTIHSNTMLTIRGGGGEILRSTSGGRAMSNKFNLENRRPSDSASEEAKWLAETYTKNTLITDRFRELMKSSIIESYEFSRGENFEERMNSFYFNYRNRSHFGHARHSNTSNDMPLQLLSNPYFLEASRKITFKERSEGLLVEDIFELAAPELLAFPFEDQLWTERLARDPLEVDLESDGWIESYDENLKDLPKAAFFNGWGRGERNEKFEFDSEQSSVNYVTRGFSLIEAHAPASLRNDLLAQHTIILKALRQKKLNAFNLVAKVASALDVFVPFSSNGNGIRMTCKRSALRDQISSRVLTPSKPKVISDGISNMPVFEQKPEMIRNEYGFTIRANPQGQITILMDYAFYLLRDGKRIAQRWYEESESADFTGNFDEGTYSAISFARPKGETAPTYQLRAGTIIIGA